METVNVNTGYSLVDIVHLAIALGIIIAAGLSVFYIFVGGISFILSGGQEDKIKEAVHTIRYAIIGLVVTLFAVTMISIVGKILNIDLIPYFQWDRMIEILQSTLDRIFSDDAGGGGGNVRSL
jgi:hypothetical protein